MDPLANIVPDIHDCILQHFNGKDILKATEVSPSWNAVLENSKMIKSVKLSLKLPAESVYIVNKFREVERELDNISRRYQSLSIDFASFGDPIFEFALKLLEFLVISAPMLVELEVKSLRVEGGDNKRLFDKLDLSKLKVLKLHDVPPGATSMLLSRCNSVIKLELKGAHFACYYRADQPRISIPNLIPFLVRNESLQDMELYGEKIHTVMLEAATHETVRLKLKRLKLSNGTSTGYIRHYMSESIEENFLRLLQSQSQSLESLNISYCRPHVMNYIFNLMPALTSLSVVWFCPNEAEVTLNEKIVELSVMGSHFVNFTNIFRVLPNLTTLFLANLDEDILKVVVSNLPHLRTLRVIGNSIKVNDPIWASNWPGAIVSYDETQRFGWTVKR